jgi:hypothetical protein
MATAGEMKTHKHVPAMDKHTDESQGQPIRKIAVNGYTLDYRLIDISQSMPDMAGTYHLMVMINDAQGKTVNGATVNFLIKGPDGKEQKLNAMAMGAGFGRNVRFTSTGTYLIQTDASIGNKHVIDSFDYKTLK